MRRIDFIRSLTGFALFVPASRLFAAELEAGDGSSRPVAPPVRRIPRDVESFLRERRAVQIARVSDYARRGVFPRNLDFAGERIPYFLDDRGVACAVANLMIEDGNRDSVEAISRADNHVRVMNVSGGALLEWVLASGLLQEEAARVQPGYDFMDRPTPFPTPEPGIVERRRIQRHLHTVVAELRRNSEVNLPIAIDRYERSLRAGG